MGGSISAFRFFLCVSALTVVACHQPGERAGTVVVVDDAGDSVAVRVPAARVVSLIPASTELLFAIGAGGAVVGRTEWCNYPGEAAAVPNLGAGINPNVEAVIAARPDLVVLYNSAQHAVVATRLRELGDSNHPDQYRRARGCSSHRENAGPVDRPHARRRLDERRLRYRTRLGHPRVPGGA